MIVKVTFNFIQI